MGSAGAKATPCCAGEVDAYVHGGGQYEWDSAAPVAVARAAGLHASRVDGSPLRLQPARPVAARTCSSADAEWPDRVVALIGRHRTTTAREHAAMTDHRATSCRQLQTLEAEAIHIIREVVAEFERPVLLFSGGKDSIVMLRLAEKAF